MKFNTYRKAEKLIRTFTVKGLDANYEMTRDVHIPAFFRDNEIIISAENVDSEYFADYYGEFRGGGMWVNPELEAALSKIGCFLEWVNPGCLKVYEI